MDGKDNVNLETNTVNEDTNITNANTTKNLVENNTIQN